MVHSDPCSCVLGLLWVVILALVKVLDIDCRCSKDFFLSGMRDI